jgi:hypothetical protein
MRDLFHLSGPWAKGDVQIFNHADTTNALQWATWQKPRGVTMSYMIGIGPGGGGGGGFTGIAGSARGGGGGGGSGGCTALTCPTAFLPDSLKVFIAPPGVGVLSGSAGTGDGLVVFFGNVLATMPTNRLIRCAATTAATSGTGAAGGAAGGASGNSIFSETIFAGLGVAAFIGGQAGGAGGSQAGANGTDVALNTGSAPTMGGTGGGGTTSADFRGGDITGAGWLGEQKPSTGVAGSTPGSGGYICWNPLYFMGGVGGGSSNADVGGNGGNGGYGCGGGGGGAGTTGGRGGDGGSGLVVIISW